MPRLVVNPHLLVCSDYTSPNFEAIRQLSRFPKEDPAATAQRLVAIWTAGNNQDRVAWTAQVAADTAAAVDAERDRLEQEAANKAKVEKELNKKKPKLLPLNPGGMPSILPVHAPPYAFHKLELIEYVKLYYFALEVCHEGSDSFKSTTDDTFTLAHSDEGLTLRAASSSCPSCKVIPDSKLSWEQFFSACTVFMVEIQRAKWPAALTQQMAFFLFALENHPMALVLEYGKQVMLLIQASVHRSWHALLKTPQNFNISVINDIFVDRTASEYTHGMQYSGIGLFLFLLPPSRSR
ncbi:hypothetical protein HETIRDRAFT_324454 [Heterobasidion irregulare TC 32-1]|uniref:Uncharacterized protein n=1 Tax=Heterobasidion irregulare (strain TC 32-1) TaxID=747525 RepID=W4JYV1_HETIT|nr:uncharacterized protein HETIRDRAFT_324454 [Heterobasidion irregulare TC 32-1]ETW78728.1 hypothetical protein HETIRDRAFT_324454 [Heterobasidion irregulare TC 32-1]